ncbi:TetR/AcrR family transcriptional regulator [Streptomyces sp. NPDC127068]|uniref:TetR/AcrR family transcriptional regulator n=1 Tax=Streptomyces sp. NPDC127068 TaxID=3347127 RepID=UPI003653E010
MGRPRTFDEGRAVEAACRVFWLKGYEGATTEDLCQATGLGRSSVYNTFTSKSHLFRRCLSHYMDTTGARQVSIMENAGPDGLGRVQALLEAIVEAELESRREGYGSGCFTVNTITALAYDDPETAAILDKDKERRLLALRSVIRGGQRDGSITSPEDPHALAWYVASTIYGMRVAAQSGAPEDILRRIVATGAVALAP